MKKSEISLITYKKIGPDIFLIISTVLIAPLWANNGLMFIKNFEWYEALVLNILCLLPIFWGFWIYRIMQKIEKLIIYSLDNNTRKSIKDTEEIVAGIAKDIIDNNEPYKSVGIHSIIWFFLSITVIIIHAIRIAHI